MREIELLPDFPIREALGRELGDLELLRRQLSPASGHAAANSFARGPQLSASPLRVPQQAESVERLGCLTKRRTRLRQAPVPPQPDPVGELRACDVERPLRLARRDRA